MLLCRERSRVDGRGMPSRDSKTFHLAINKGAQPGQKHVMEGEGDEAVDTLPGDLVFVLQQKPHAKLRRSGLQLRNRHAAELVCLMCMHNKVYSRHTM